MYAPNKTNSSFFSENNYQEEKCSDVIAQLIKCCLSKPNAQDDVTCSTFIKQQQQQQQQQKHQN